MSYEYLGLIPYRHQLETIDFYLRNKRAYNFSGLGSGKTASTIWASDMLIEAGKIKKILIICPLSIMKSVWGDEIKQVAPNRSYSIVHGTETERKKALEKKVNYYITNHDAVRTYYKLIIKAGFDIVVIDEVDAYKNPRSKRSKAMQLIEANTDALWGLTGSPIANSPMEAFGIAKVINPVALPTKYVTRWKQLTMVQLTQFLWEPNPWAEEICMKALQPAIAYKLDDCIDIPDISHEFIEFKMGAVQARHYKQMKNDQMIEHSKGLIIASTAAVKYSKLLQISAGAVYTQDGEVVILPIKEKIDEINRIQSQSETGQIIVFSQFIKVADHLHENLDSSRIIYGATPRRQRDIILSEFKRGLFNILIAQPRILAHGVNLQFCSTIIFFSPVLGNSYYRQAIGRIRRSGQVRKQLIINFVSTPAEKKLYKMLAEREVNNQMLLEMFYESTK